jgi:hypothetical protein
MSRIQLWFRNPIFLLGLAAGLIAFVVQSGEVGSADTMHRLQSTHAFWTSQPPVFPNEYPEFGVHGRNGSLQSWYGIGQSLLMLPSDILGTSVAKLKIFDQYGDTDPTVRDIVVVYLSQIFVTALTALLCFKLLRQFAFTINHSIAGTLAFLLATTHLHYTQNMMENNYICLLTLAGFSFQYQWLQSGSRRALLIGTAAFGLNLLTRITTGMDLLAVFSCSWFSGSRRYMAAHSGVVAVNMQRHPSRSTASSGPSIVFTSSTVLDRSPIPTRASSPEKPSRATQASLATGPGRLPGTRDFWVRSSCRKSQSFYSIR